MALPMATVSKLTRMLADLYLTELCLQTQLQIIGTPSD